MWSMAQKWIEEILITDVETLIDKQVIDQETASIELTGLDCSLSCCISENVEFLFL